MHGVHGGAWRALQAWGPEGGLSSCAWKTSLRRTLLISALDGDVWGEMEGGIGRKLVFLCLSNNLVC